MSINTTTLKKKVNVRFTSSLSKLNLPLSDKEVKSRIVNYFYKLVRNDTEHYANIVYTSHFEKELNQLIHTCIQPHPVHKQFYKYADELVALYMMIGYTRDIYFGKGECDFTYMQIWVWYQHFPQLALYALEKCVYLDDNAALSRTTFSTLSNKQPYGSWKDIRNMAYFVYQKTRNKKHPIIQHCVTLFSKQLYSDLLRKIHEDDEKVNISLAAKWCPRENKKGGWLFRLVAVEYYLSILGQTRKAKCKMYKTLRKDLTFLTTDLHITETYLCRKDRTLLQFHHMPSLALRKYQSTLLNIKHDILQKYSNVDCKDVKFKEDNKRCATRFIRFLHSNYKLSGKGMSYYHFLQDTVHLCQMFYKTNSNIKMNTNINVSPYLSIPSHFEKVLTRMENACNQRIQKQWTHFIRPYRNTDLPYCIPILDLRRSMEDHKSHALYNAIGHAIHLSEITCAPFKHRILTISNKPEWINLSPFDTFVNKVKYILSFQWGSNGNLYKTFELLTEMFVKHDFDPNDVSKITCCVFSHYQHDSSEGSNGNCDLNKLHPTLKDKSCEYKNIQTIFEVAGLRTTHKTIFKSPRLVFTNCAKFNYGSNHEFFKQDCELLEHVHNVQFINSGQNGSFLKQLQLDKKFNRNTNECDNVNDHDHDHDHNNDNYNDNTNSITTTYTAYDYFERTIYKNNQRYVSLRKYIYNTLQL